MKRNILKKVLLGAAIVGSVSFGTNAVFADTVDVSSFGELQTAIKNATAATTINILNDITDIDKDMKLLDQDIVIEGSGHSFVSKGDHVGMDITGEGSGGSFTRPSSLTIKNATVKDFKKTNGWGSAIYNDGILTLENVNFENNHNYGSGSKAGAITNNRLGVATISGNMSYVSNTSDNGGGAIWNAAEMEIHANSDANSAKFTSNKSNKSGGGAVYNSGTLSMDGDYIFSSNTAKRMGGAISNDGRLTIKDGSLTFADNKSNIDSTEEWGNGGGAIYNNGNMTILTTGSDKIIFNGNDAVNSRGGAIYNKSNGNLTLNGTFDFLNNGASAKRGGAIFNQGEMSLSGVYNFTGNQAVNSGGAIVNERGNLNILGVDNSGSYSIIFDKNNVVGITTTNGNGTTSVSDSKGGAIHITGSAEQPAFLNVKGASFTNNSATSHGGAIYVDTHVNFNVEDSLFRNNIVSIKSAGHGWGGAIGLDSQNDNVHGYISNSIFEGNYAGDAGGAIPAGTALTIENSTFMGNHAGNTGGAISYNPRYNLTKDKALKIIANAGNTVFSGNWVGDSSTRDVKNSEGLYLGNAIVDANGKSIVGEDGNDSNVYFNAGNQGKLIFNDIVNADGNSVDDSKEKNDGKRDNVNNPNIQLNKDISYSKFTPTGASSDTTVAPTDGMIIFNNQIKAANLVLHNGFLQFGQKNNIDGYFDQSLITNYFSEGAKITLKGGTLDLINNNIEEGDKFNPDELNVLGNANLRLDLDIVNGKIDFINSTIKDTSSDKKGVLTIDRISFGDDKNSDLAFGGEGKKLQFVKANELEDGKTILDSNLNTIITTNAGYTLDLDTTNVGKDSITVKKIVNAGGLPVAISLGIDPELASARTYVYNATADEEILDWNKPYSVLLESGPKNRTASNVLRGKELQINGNGKNVFTSAGVIGIELGKEENTGENQKLVINDVKGENNTDGWKGFNSALIIHDGGTVEINNSIFRENKSSADTEHNKAGNGGAVINEVGGTLNIKNSQFLDNEATGMGGAIYNEGTVNITATDEGTVEFNGNKSNNVGNDIYNKGTLNLASTSGSAIIFNDGISGDTANKSANLINIGTSNLGDVIFNSTVENQSINLDGGTLKLGANATSSNDNYFNNVDLTVGGGVLDTANGYIDQINIDNWTINGNNSKLSLDAQVGTTGSTGVSDYINANVLGGSGTLYIDRLNILDVMAEGENSKDIEFTNQTGINSAISEALKSLTIGNTAYSVSVSGNVLHIIKTGTSGGFAWAVTDNTAESRTFELSSVAGNDEIVDRWIRGNELFGSTFQILGGKSGNSLIAQNGIEGVIVGTYQNQAQNLIIEDVKSYQGFNHAIINNGGNVQIKNTTFESNRYYDSSDISNGGAIQNNSGNVEIKGGTVFRDNGVTGNGGAIYNAAAANLKFTTESGNDITFEQNAANGEGDDIFNEGKINITGDGVLNITRGIGGGGDNAEITNDGATINLGGDLNNFSGKFTQNSGTTNVTGSFFTGESVIAGTLNWNTAKDLEKGALTFKGGNLNLASGSQLTIQGNSSLEGSNKVDVKNGATLIFGKDETVKNITGSGTVQLKDGKTLTFDSSSSFANSLKFESVFATANLVGTTEDNTSSIISAITGGTNKNLSIILDNLTLGDSINVDGYGGNILQITTRNSVTINSSITGSTKGNIYNEGNLTINADQSGFQGAFAQSQEGAVTTVSKSDYLFGGTKSISDGNLNISSGTVDYESIALIDNANLNQTITSTVTGKINSDTLTFGGSGNSANFVSDGVVGNLELGNVNNYGVNNKIQIEGSKVTLTDTNFSGRTSYILKNSELNLIEETANNNIKDYVFDNVQTENTKLSFNVEIVRGDDKNTLKTDTITINNSANGVQNFEIGNIYITGEENGRRDSDYLTEKDVLNGNVQFSGGTADIINGATTSWKYKVSQNGDKTIKLAIDDYAGRHTLYDMNNNENKRFFQFTQDDDRIYYIDKSLSETLHGDFSVIGFDRDKHIISGKIDDSTNGSFFDIKNLTNSTNLNIQDVTIQEAHKDGSGSVISQITDKGTVTITNANIKDNSATGNGGAIYNELGKVTSTNTGFTGNKSDANGGAIFNSSNMTINLGTFENNAAQFGGAIYNAANGELTLNGVTVKKGTDTALNDIYQEADGQLTFNSVKIGEDIIANNIESNIRGEGKITNEGILNLSGDNSDFLGEFEQTSGMTTIEGENAKFFGTTDKGTSTISGGLLNWFIEDNDSSIQLNVKNDATLIVGKDENQNSTLEISKGIIEKTAKVLINKNSTLEATDSGAEINLNNNDAWIGNVLVADGGVLNLKDLNGNGKIFGNKGGTINIKSGDLFINDPEGTLESEKSTIIEEAKINIEDGSRLIIANGNVTINGQSTGNVTEPAGFDDSDSWKGTIGLTGNGNLTVKKEFTSNGKLIAEAGNLTITDNGKLIVGTGSVIADAAKTTIDADSTLDIQGGTINIGDDDDWKGTISLGTNNNGGTLNYGTTNSGTFKALSGNLNLLDGSILNIQDPSSVAKKVDVDIRRGATVNVNAGADFNLDERDKWNGKVTLNNGGKFTTDKVNNILGGGIFQQNGGESTFDNNSDIYIFGDSYINGGNTNILGGSTLHLGSDVTMNTDSLTMGGNSTLNIMNNTLDINNVGNMQVNGKNNVAIDLNPRDHVGDTIIIDNLNGSGTLNISDFNFVGKAPIDRNINFQIFNPNNVSDVDFTASDKQIFTPIGHYKLVSQGGGFYTASLADYNPQVFRGQVTTLAAYNHQLLIDDMLTNHFILPNERLIDDAAQANKISSISPLYAPYQHSLKEGGLWTKSYVSFETLSMTHGLNVGNNVYGTLIGADFPMVNLKNGWKFIPTAFIGYNGGNQNFNNVSAYQNGGQGGFMGTFLKNDFIGSIAAYGGGYLNEMNVAGYTDQAGNWFAGTSAKAAYNLHATKHLIVQPTAFISYNIFGRQNWGTDFGEMSMNSGLLNGINVAPGLNLIYSRETWSVYGTVQYMFNINDQVGGKAGNVDLDNISMRHGYLNYGIGVTKTWKDRLNSYLQINFRNGGRTGVGFQLGLNFLFDWFNPNKKVKSAAPTVQPKPQKTVIKSLSMK